MQHTTPERPDFYRNVHRGLRLAMSEVLIRLARTSFADPRDRLSALLELSTVLDLCESHLHHENEHIHAALERRAPGAAADFFVDHAHHEEAIRELRALAEEVGAGTTGPAAARALYLRYSAFVADNLAHMIEEEERLMPRLHAEFDDQELHEIEHGLISSVAPDKMMAFMRFMIPAVDRQDRLDMLAGMKQGAPPEAFAAVLSVARANLPPDDYRDLAAELAQ